MLKMREINDFNVIIRKIANRKIVLQIFYMFSFLIYVTNRAFVDF